VATLGFVNDFLARFGTAYRAAGMPDSAQVYHGQSSAGDHVYFLSPAAAAISRDVLEAFQGQPCTTAPNVAGLQRIAL
jgi:hypothetical protein